VSAITDILLPLFVTRSHQIAQKSMKIPFLHRYGSLRSTERERDQSRWGNCQHGAGLDQRLSHV